MTTKQTFDSTITGNEGVDAYERLSQDCITIVSSRWAVPKGCKYIVIDERIGLLRMPLAILFMLLEWWVARRFAPWSYAQTYIRGGNVWYEFGRKRKWSAWHFDSRRVLATILHWLHPKGLRYIVVQTTSDEGLIAKVVNVFNRDLEQKAQIRIMVDRNRLRGAALPQTITTS